MASMASVIVYNLTQSHSKAGNEERVWGKFLPLLNLLPLIMEEKSFPEAVWKKHFLLYLSFPDHTIT